MTVLAAEPDLTLLDDLDDLELWEVDLVTTAGEELGEPQRIDRPPTLVHRSWTVARPLSVDRFRVYRNGESVPTGRDGRLPEGMVVHLRAGDTFCLHLDLGAS